MVNAVQPEFVDVMNCGRLPIWLLENTADVHIIQLLVASASLRRHLLALLRDAASYRPIRLQDDCVTSDTITSGLCYHFDPWEVCMYLTEIQIWEVTFACECRLTEARDLRYFSTAVQRAMYAATKAVVEASQFELHFCSFLFPLRLFDYFGYEYYHAPPAPWDLETPKVHIWDDTSLYLCIDWPEHSLSINSRQDESQNCRLKAIYAVSTTVPNLRLHTTTCKAVHADLDQQVVLFHNVLPQSSVMRALKNGKPLSFIVLVSY